MVTLKIIAAVLTALLSLSTHNPDAAPVRVDKRALNAGAPLASDVGGATIIIDNDVDTNTSKVSFLLLSKPRGYYDGMSACTSMNSVGYIYISGTAAATSLVKLLNNNAPAQAEVAAYSQFWVYNGVPGVLWRDQLAFRFLGIPYAEPPVGNRRFAAPVAKAPFTGTFDAIDYKGVCPQTAQSAGFLPLVMSYLENGATEMEDCLNLNVYTPSLKGANQTLLPVMFYIHGGGFTTYSGSVILFEPGNLVSRGGVVVVTINYRLGLLGWAENSGAWGRSDVTGNQALRDQILALQWVQKNIASFGGDPTRVTIFGESAGATSIRAMLSTPTAWPLYQGVIGESDPIDIGFKTSDSATKITQYFLTALGCNTTDLTCARSKSVEAVLEAQSTANAQALADDKWTTWALVERPTIDGELITQEFSALVKAGTYNTKANIMWGTVHDEAGLFVPQYFPNPIPPANVSNALELVFSPARTAQALQSQYLALDPNDPDAVRNLFTRIGTQFYFFCPLRYLTRSMTKRKPVYMFRFNRGRDTPLVGQGYCSASTGRVCHSADIQPVFASGAAVPGFSQTGDDARFARQVVDRFTAFAKSGNPNPQTGVPGVEGTNPDVTSVNFLAYDDTNPILELNVTSSVSHNDENDVCTWTDTEFLYDFWLEIPGNSP
ncbi:hypothetical protein CPC16_009607 [Podila verticillata]|nr:hypothetical protein CPC16_009607 [Podila verticillata]